MEVDFNAVHVLLQPVLTTTVYSARDAIGSLMSAALVEETTGTGTLLSVKAVDTLGKTPGIDILFYSQQPGGTITDNSALAITAADHASFFLGRVSIASSDWCSSTTQNVNTNVVDVTKNAASCGVKLKATGGSGLIWIVFMCVTVPSAAYSAGAGNLSFGFGVDQD